MKPIHNLGPRAAFALCLAIASLGLTSLAVAYPAPPPRPAFKAVAKLPDAVLYQNIFALQNNANWRRADRLINQLEKPTLMGHVLFQRYMHPTGYRARWTELRDWLKNYADQPGAWQVYKLAQKRKPRGVSMPKRPPSRVYFNEKLSSGQSLFRTRTARRIKNKVSGMVRRERPTQALKYIQQKAQDTRLKAAETDFLKSLIARSYYIEGKVPQALELALQATRSRTQVQMADWHVGLAAYRLGKLDLAIHHFEKLALNRTASSKLRAQASYWAARGLRHQGKIKEAELHLRSAATSGPNFYALLAMQHMRNGLIIDWRRADENTGNLFATHPALRRAQALREAAQEELAELELLYLQERVSEIDARALLSYARDNDYPAVQLALASRLGGRISNGLPLPLYESSYPVVDMSPTDKNQKGELVDAALVHALVRQESRFKARAKSHAGARGLMQIMPGTAAFITGDRSLFRRSGRDQLLDAELNLEIGNRYLSMLLSDKYFDKSLIHALAAYNGGPGNVRRWRRELKNVADPLLFIESLPAPETRDYVQKVMSNLWIYRHRLRQEPISQRILAAESWPRYHAQDRDVAAIPVSVK
ncbi:MAG: lytic transglycosylase domain-containing protein [Rhodobiaceae bacterium]|nr:lytic transglycosylase domain-containing protein [Rhodobiaceae bacterium]